MRKWYVQNTLRTLTIQQWTILFKKGQKIWTDISPRKIHDWQINMKRCPTSGIISKLQIKTTMKYTMHLWEWSKSKIQHQMLARMWNNRTLIHWKRGCKRVQPLWKLVWWFLIKISILLPHDPAIVLLKELKNPNKNLHMYFIAALLIISKI